MIRLENITWHAGAFRLDGVSFAVPANSYAVLMGRTGSGKTSLIEILCGLRQPKGGRIWIADRDVTELPPGMRGIGYVPQDGALFPTMTVAEQLGFALRVRHRPADEIAGRVRELSAQLGIAHLHDRLPQNLSGGERQRVALGRALAARPSVLLLDEPLSDSTRTPAMKSPQYSNRPSAIPASPRCTSRTANAKRHSSPMWFSNLRVAA